MYNEPNIWTFVCHNGAIAILIDRCTIAIATTTTNTKSLFYGLFSKRSLRLASPPTQPQSIKKIKIKTTTTTARAP